MNAITYDNILLCSKPDRQNSYTRHQKLFNKQKLLNLRNKTQNSRREEAGEEQVLFVCSAHKFCGNSNKSDYKKRNFWLKCSLISKVFFQCLIRLRSIIPSWFNKFSFSALLNQSEFIFSSHLISIMNPIGTQSEIRFNSSPKFRYI